MFPRFGITAYPVETVDTSLTSWSSIIMFVALTIALPLVVFSFDWFSDIDPYNQIGRFFTKLGFGILCLASVGSVLILPFVLMKRAETPGSVWTVWIICVIIGLTFRWLMKQYGLSSQDSWIITAIFVVLCFLGAVLISLSLLITALIAQITASLGIIALVAMGFIALATKSR